MNFRCEHCGRRYRLADEKVRGRSIRVRCKHCGHITALQGPNEAEPTDPTGAVRAEQEELTRAMPAWFILTREGQEGPLGADALLRGIRSGEVTLSTYLWRDGMAEWKRGSEVPELLRFFEASEPDPRPGPPIAGGAEGREDPLDEKTQVFTAFTAPAEESQSNPRWMTALGVLIGIGLLLGLLFLLGVMR